MPYDKPTLSALIENVKADLYSRFPSLDPTIINSISANMAEVIAAASTGFYGYLEWSSLQPFVDTAEDESLDRLAANYDVTRGAATRADGDCTFTGVIGATVAEDEEMTSTTGQRYTVDGGFTLLATSEVHSVTAQTGGTDGNVGAGGELTFVSTPSDMDAIATIGAGGLTGGTDRDSNDELRAAIKAKISSPPKGGKPDDFDTWAKEATDATRTWQVNSTNDVDHQVTVPDGHVWQYFVMDTTYVPDGIPLAGDVADLQAYIDPIRPIAATYTAKGLVANPITFDVTISPDNATTQAAVEEELQSEILLSRTPGGTINLSAFYEAMSKAAGLTSWTVNLIEGVSPAQVTVGNGEIHTLGTVTFS